MKHWKYDVLQEKYPFWHYARDNLMFHISQCEESLTMDPVLEFLNKRGCVGLYLYYSDATGVGSSPLAVACMLNHSLAAWSLIEKGEHLQYRGGYRRTLLHFTFSNKLDRSKDFIKYYRVERKAEIVSLLFNAGLDISTPDEDGKQYFTLQPALRGAGLY